MAIGIASKCKVNANIGASPNASDAAEEVKKLKLAVSTAPTRWISPQVASILMRSARQSLMLTGANWHGACVSGAGERARLDREVG